MHDVFSPSDLTKRKAPRSKNRATCNEIHFEILNNGTGRLRVDVEDGVYEWIFEEWNVYICLNAEYKK